MESFRLETMGDLRESDYNPRDIKRAALEGLKVSIEAFGDLSGVVWNARTGRIVCGHQRLRAVKERYGDDARLVLDPESGPRIEFPSGSLKVRVVGWDEPTEKAANVAANSSTIAGDFTAGLDGLLDEIERELPDLSEALMLDDLRAGAGAIELDDDGGLTGEELGEIPVTPELLESHNYLLFVFDNEMDWNVVVDVFKVRKVRASDHREGFARVGVGRVVKGADLLALIGRVRENG